ncbi:zinc ribbon domain-containing protein [Brevibacillus halotolerans]|nr:recombinase zinc beta ribbon domain-containing protein [Brevibacillus laterosporus]MCZ0836417.1 zinc ribbon domain-containing protein [Brevibacillus halotolerans]
MEVWRGKRYTSRYYRCSSTQNDGDRKCTQNGINAEKLEKLYMMIYSKNLQK